jgi:hypothetical protein
MLASWLKSIALGALVALSPLASAEGGASGVPQPVIQKGLGEKCVEDTEYMRRNHMEVLEHHRDRTVHEGIRTKQHSLKNCIECHATPDATGQRTVLGKDHFCQSCHTYAAVKIDCFECHSSKPAGNGAMHPIVSSRTGPGSETATSMRHHSLGKVPNLNSTLSVQDLAGVIK